jgi:hypothetical protein
MGDLGEQTGDPLDGEMALQAATQTQKLEERRKEIAALQQSIAYAPIGFNFIASPGRSERILDEILNLREEANQFLNQLQARV